MDLLGEALAHSYSFPLPDSLSQLLANFLSGRFPLSGGVILWHKTCFSTIYDSHLHSSLPPDESVSLPFFFTNPSPNTP